MIKTNGQQQFDLGNIRQPGMIDHAPNARAFLESEGADVSALKPMSRQDLYSTYLHYRNDKERVDAGGAPAPGLEASYDELRSFIPGQAARAAKVAKPTMDPNYDDNPYQPEDMIKEISEGGLRVAPTTPDQSTVAWDNNTNDQFRALHDIIGHAGVGSSFSPNGETMTAQAHIQTAPSGARKALASEVIGQIAYGEFTGNFVDQKGLYDVPDWAARGESPPRIKKLKTRSPYQQGSLF